MANISTEIKNFLTAIYGKDVRAALVSLAEKLNNEVENNTTEAKNAAENANTAASNADVATKNANSAAGVANTAGENANTAAGEARTAAQNAQNATQTAHDAAGNANAAAGRVDSAISAASEATDAANLATSNADNAASVANQAAANAQDAASVASALAGVANAAGANADSAAAAANEAAGNANAAAENANTAAVNANAVPEKVAALQVDVTELKGKTDTLSVFAIPEMYGAIGDGVTDDSEALKQCFVSEKPILLNNKYKITETITTENETHIFGNGVVYVSCERGFKIANSGSIQGVKMVADSAECINLVGFSDGDKCILDNVEITSNYTFDGHGSSTMVVFTNCENVIINNPNISNLRSLGNGTIEDSTGNLTGIYTHDCGNVIVNGCKADDICNVDSSGNTILEDSNAVYVYGESTEFKISDSHFKNAGKRHIKTQCGKSHVSNCYFYHDTEDLVVALGFNDTGSENEAYSVVDNCIFDIRTAKSGAFAIASSENLKCSNSYFFTDNYAVYLNGKHEYSNCHIEGVALIDSTGNEQNFYDCYIEKLTGNGTGMDMVNLYNCEVDNADGLINAYNTEFGVLRTRDIESNTEELIFDNCVLATSSTTGLEAKCRLINCSNKNGVQVRIQNNCLVDGFCGDGLNAVSLMGSGTIILKRVDLLETSFYYHPSEKPTIVCYPTPTNGIPLASHGFEGARIFNIQDYKYYVFENDSWWPAVEQAPPTSITATFTQGETVVYDINTLESLKSMLVIKANYDSGRTMTVTDYTLSGTLAAGTSTITVEYEGLTTTFDVVVTEVTNLVPFSIDASGNVYNTTGYKTDYRFNSGGTESAQEGAICCGFLPIVDLSDAIRITGHDGGSTMTSGHNRVMLYNSAFTKVGHFDIQSARAGCEVSTNANDTHEIKLIMSEYTGMTGTTDGAVYFRVCLGVCSDPTKFIVTRNKEII